MLNSKQEEMFFVNKLTPSCVKLNKTKKEYLKTQNDNV